MTIAPGNTILASDILAIQSTANSAIQQIAGVSGTIISQADFWAGLLNGLPTTLPDEPGIPWNNGGILSIS